MIRLTAERSQAYKSESRNWGVLLLISWRETPAGAKSEKQHNEDHLLWKGYNSTVQLDPTHCAADFTLTD